MPRKQPASHEPPPPNPDDVLRIMLNTPPHPHSGAPPRPKKPKVAAAKKRPTG